MHQNFIFDSCFNETQKQLVKQKLETLLPQNSFNFANFGETTPESTLITLVETRTRPEEDWCETNFANLKIRFHFNIENSFMTKLRRLFVKPVTFAGGGPGAAELATVAATDALKECDICFYDALIDKKLLNLMPKHAEAIYVGKRCHNHSTKQKEICRLLCDAARKGLRVVRLKGGDPGIFGRLTEEVDALTALSLPFRTIAGISSVIAATTETGLLLTRREISRGFCVQTPSLSEGKIELPEKNTPLFYPTEVFYMAIRCITQLSRSMINSGRKPTTPVAVIFSAGTPNRIAVCGNLETISDKVKDTELPEPKPPGLIIVGDSADESFLYKNFAPLHGKRILFCNPENSNKKELAIRDLGATPVFFDIYRKKALTASNICQITSAEALFITSPLAADTFMKAVIKCEAFDIRSLPLLYCPDEPTAIVLKQFGLMASQDPAPTNTLTIHYYCSDTSLHNFSLAELSVPAELPQHDFAILNNQEQTYFKTAGLSPLLDGPKLSSFNSTLQIYATRFLNF